MKKIFLATLFASALVLSACGGKTAKTAESENPATEKTTTSSATSEEHAMLGVKGECDMCKERIENAAKGVDGVSTAVWDGEKKEVHLHFDPSKTNVEAISKAIATVGHDTDKDKADDAVYNALPGCCKYRG